MLGTGLSDTALLWNDEAVLLVEQLNMAENTSMASKSLGALGLDMDKEKLLACLRRAGDPHVEGGDKPTRVLFTNKIPVETCERMEELAKLKRGLELRELYLEGERKDHAWLFHELADLAASTVPPPGSLDITRGIMENGHKLDAVLSYATS